MPLIERIRLVDLRLQRRKYGVAPAYTTGPPFTLKEQSAIRPTT